MIAFVIGMIFPVQSFLWYYRQKVRVELWLRNKQNTLSNMLSVDDHINAVRERSNAIRSGIISRKTIKCNTTQDGIRVSNMSLESPKELELSLEQRVLACISMFGYGMLPLIASGGLFGSAFFFACFYLIGYGMVAPYFIKKKHPLNSCTEWSLITLLLTVVSLIGISIGDSIFYEVVVLVPVVVVIALGVLLLFI